MNEITFEAVQIALRKDKNGYILVLSIHPNDVPAILFTDPLGTRYGVAMVKITDEEDQAPAVSEGEKAVRQAGMLCRNSKFQEFLGAKDEEECAERLKDMLGIKSRRELATNREARRIFDGYIAEFTKGMEF